MLMQRKKSYGWTPTRSTWSCHASPSRVFPPYYRAVLNADSSNLHQQQALWAAWLVRPEGVLDLCLVTDNSWPCLVWLMCMCAFSTYHLKMETDQLSEDLCFLSNCEIMDTGQKPCNSSHCNILYYTEFINFLFRLTPPSPPQKKRNLQIYLCCSLRNHISNRASYNILLYHLFSFRKSVQDYIIRMDKEIVIFVGIKVWHQHKCVQQSHGYLVW